MLSKRWFPAMPTLGTLWRWPEFVFSTIREWRDLLRDLAVHVRVLRARERVCSQGARERRLDGAEVCRKRNACRGDTVSLPLASGVALVRPCVALCRIRRPKWTVSVVF